MDSSTKKANRLIKEKSPYLLQHAHDPVDWHAWGEDAFQIARAQDKPILLSIGFSTCHWCHVMAAESYNDPEIALILNRAFVAILVDREQRPDVDAVYMNVCRVFSGSGGWPMTILMTPQRQPFYAGTYFPKDGSFGRVGLRELLLSTEEQWRKEADKLRKAGEHLVRQAQKLVPQHGPDEVAEPATALLPAQELAELYDQDHGGFGRAPKFPSPHQLLYLMECRRRSRNEKAGNMALHTLTAMYRGGLFDHVGGGFARYSTDERFLVPHFEKMLEDNALLVMAYVEAYRLTGRRLFQTVAERTLAYALDELGNSDGGFYSAQDADARDGEGSYYLLTPGEVAAVLGRSDAKWFCEHYAITPEGCYEGKCIPHLLNNEGYEQEPRTLPQMREKVYEFRKARMPLHTDKKIRTGANALMAAALCRACRAFGGEHYLNAAVRTVEYIHEQLTPGGLLHASFDLENVRGRATLEDHAYLAWAYLELYRTTQEPVWLASLAGMADVIRRDFTDEENGGFFLAAADVDDLVFRPKELYDGSAPSGNSVAAYALCALAELTGELDWRERADAQLLYLAPGIRQSPAGHCFAALALLLRTTPNRELVALFPDARARKQALTTLHPHLDDSLWMVSVTPEEFGPMARLAPMLREHEEQLGRTLYYLCREQSCYAPLEALPQLEALLRQTAGDKQDL